MWLYGILAVLAGLLAVVQSGLTRKIAPRAGLAMTLHVSNAVVLVGGLVILTSIAFLADGDFAKLLKGKFDWHAVSWWFVLPGLCGLFIVTVSPFAVGKIGALPVFIAMIFGQVFGSALWDWEVEGQPLDRYRLIAATLSLASVLVLVLSKGQTE